MKGGSDGVRTVRSEGVWAELTACVGPNGASVPAAVSAAGPGVFRAEFVPRAVGEHRLNVLVDSTPIPASPFHLKVSIFPDYNIILTYKPPC